MKETTVAGILGIYFRHLKAIASSKLLSNFEATIYYIPYKIGYSPSDWKVAINTMIEKKGKGNQVSDLRIINLMKADFNFNNKTLAKEVLRYGE